MAGIGPRFGVPASQRRLTEADFENFLTDMQALVGSAVIETVVRGSKSFLGGSRPSPLGAGPGAAVPAEEA